MTKTVTVDAAKYERLRKAAAKYWELDAGMIGSREPGDLDPVAPDPEPSVEPSVEAMGDMVDFALLSEALADAMTMQNDPAKVTGIYNLLASIQRAIGDHIEPNPEPISQLLDALVEQKFEVNLRWYSLPRKMLLECSLYRPGEEYFGDGPNASDALRAAYRQMVDPQQQEAE